ICAVQLTLFRPNGKVSPITLADRAREGGEWETAARYYSLALARNPHRPDIWVQFGHALKQRGKLSQAESAYRRAVNANCHDAEAGLKLGHVLKLQGQIHEAERAYLEAVACDPGLASARQELVALGWTEDRVSAIPPANSSDRPPRKRRRESVITRADLARDL